MAFNNCRSDNLQYFTANNIIQFKSFVVLTQNQIPLRYTWTSPSCCITHQVHPGPWANAVLWMITGSPVLQRSLNPLFYGKSSFQKDLNYFSLSEKLLLVYYLTQHCHPCMKCSGVLYFSSLDQSMANSRSVFLPLQQSIPGVLGGPAHYCQCLEKTALAVSVVAYCLAASDSSLYWSSSRSGTAGLGGGMASCRPWQSPVSLHWPHGMVREGMNSADHSLALLMTNQLMDSVRAPWLVWYCCQCPVVVAPVVHWPTPEASSRRWGKVDEHLISTVSKAALPKAQQYLFESLEYTLVWQSRQRMHWSPGAIHSGVLWPLLPRQAHFGFQQSQLLGLPCRSRNTDGACPCAAVFATAFDCCCGSAVQGHPIHTVH